MKEKFLFLALVTFAFLFYGISIGLNGWQFWQLGTKLTWMNVLLGLVLLGVAFIFHSAVLQVRKNI